MTEMYLRTLTGLKRTTDYYGRGVLFMFFDRGGPVAVMLNNPNNYQPYSEAEDWLAECVQAWGEEVEWGTIPPDEES